MKYLIPLRLLVHQLLARLDEHRVKDERGTIVENVAWIAIVLVLVALVAAAVTAYVNTQIAKIG